METRGNKQMSTNTNVNLQVREYGLLIGGKTIRTADTIPVYDKFNGELIANIARAAREDVENAVSNARETFKTAKLTATERYEILLKTAELLKERKEELAVTLVREVGKTLKDARSEIERAVQTFTLCAEEAKRISGEGIPIAGQPGSENRIAFTVRVPVGVIGAITPFNFPLNLVAHKVAPAIAAGNTIVLKPAELTPIISFKLAEIMEEAGLPAGFFNIVTGWGHEAGQYLLEDERIAMFTFTGSPGVGRHIKSVTGIRKVTLELGNNSPNIVHKDAPDLTEAAELCVSRGYSSAGQACISVQRVYVHREIYDEFLKQAKEFASRLKVGNPADEATDIGPMIAEKEAKRAEEWIQEAVSQGARIVVGGKREGSILYPTILTDTRHEMKVMCQEVFAPIISIVPYDDIDEAFRQSNDSRFGLQVGLFTSDINLAMRAARELEFGGVIINDVSTYRADIMPYGGIKDSGIGKEGPHYTIQEMTDEKIVVINAK